jgi:hypothetical protein
MIAKAGQIIAIDSVKVDNTLSGDGVRTPLGVKATAPAVSGHAGLSAEKVDNTVYIGMEPEAVKVVSTNESVSIEKTVKSDGTVEYNLGVSVEPVVSDTKIIGSNGISARETAPATYTIGVSGDYVKSETLQDYYTKDVADETFQPKGKYVTSADASLNDKQLVLKNNKWEEVDAGTDYTAGDNIDITNDVISGRDWTPELEQKADKSALVGLATETWVGEHYVPNNVLESYYTKDEVYSKSETYSKAEVYTKDEVYTKQEVNDLIPETSNFALSADVDTAIDESEANIAYWANNRFQLSGNYASATDITSLSGTVNANFQKKGEYVTSADNSLEGKALVLKDNKWEEAPEGTVYTSGPNIKIDGTSISGRDWSPELDEKANTSDLETLATKTELIDLNAAVAGEFVETSAWANETFQKAGNYLTPDALNNYYNKSDTDTAIDTAINDVSATVARDYATKTDLAGKLDTSETVDWDVTPYTEGNNFITIEDHKISGKDWSTEIGAKQDKLSDKQLSAISSVSAIEAMSGKWVTSGVDVIAGDYYYGLVNKNGTVEWDPIPEPDYPDIVGNNGISAAYNYAKNEYDIGLSATDLAYMYDTYVNTNVSVTDGTVIKFTGNNYNHITVDTDGYFVLPETANKITFNINENIDENNPGTHSYLLNKLSLKTDKPETLVSTQNYYPAEVGSSNGTISITVDHSVDPTRKYALVYEGSTVPTSANLNITMSIVEEVTCLTDNLTNNGEDYNGVTPVTVNNDTRNVQLEYDSDIFTLNSDNELTLKAGSSDTPIDPIEFNKLVDSINSRIVEAIPIGLINNTASIGANKSWAYLTRPMIEFDMDQHTTARIMISNASAEVSKVQVAIYELDDSVTPCKLHLMWWSEKYTIPRIDPGDTQSGVLKGTHVLRANAGCTDPHTIKPEKLYYVLVINYDQTTALLGFSNSLTEDIGNYDIGYFKENMQNFDPSNYDNANVDDLGTTGGASLKPYVAFRNE